MDPTLNRWVPCRHVGPGTECTRPHASRAIARGAADVANHATIITKHFSKHVGHATFARLEDGQPFEWSCASLEPGPTHYIRHPREFCVYSMEQYTGHNTDTDALLARSNYSFWGADEYVVLGFNYLSCAE